MGVSIATCLASPSVLSDSHRDFDIDWSGIPLYLDMINELEKLRSENRTLRQRLGRFLLEE